jgi:hypothetical protein
LILDALQKIRDRVLIPVENSPLYRSKIPHPLNFMNAPPWPRPRAVLNSE